ncbi:MAG: RNase adapter RapZ [Rhodocyclaceae bacterium]
MQVVLISGLSGSGKSVALNVLEDAGFFCVDNLPATLLPHLIRHLRGAGYERAAVAVDVRSGASIAALPEQVRELRAGGADLRFIFLDARDDTLIARFSETRRSHPLARRDVTLAEAIQRERDALAEIAEIGHRIDTSDLQANALRAWVRKFVESASEDGITLLFESFGYKNGIPLDADFVFDVRCLPNPHYDPQLRPLTGRDQAVVAFLDAQYEVLRMREDIHRFVYEWLPCFVRDSRSYLTVAIGCTGGQHRSVYFAEWLAERFRHSTHVIVRHRALS